MELRWCSLRVTGSRSINEGKRNKSMHIWLYNFGLFSLLFTCEFLKTQGFFLVFHFTHNFSSDRFWYLLYINFCWYSFLYFLWPLQQLVSLLPGTSKFLVFFQIFSFFPPFLGGRLGGRKGGWGSVSGSIKIINSSFKTAS